LSAPAHRNDFHGNTSQLRLMNYEEYSTESGELQSNDKWDDIQKGNLKIYDLIITIPLQFEPKSVTI